MGTPPALALTGFDAWPWVFAGGTLVCLGVLLLLASPWQRRRR